MCMSPLVPQTNFGATDLLTAVGFPLTDPLTAVVVFPLADLSTAVGFPVCIGFRLCSCLCIGFRFAFSLCIGSFLRAALPDDVPDERACPTPRLPDRRPGEACLAGSREGNFLVVTSRACALCRGVADPTMRRPMPAT